MLVANAAAVPVVAAKRSSNRRHAGPAPDSHPEAKTSATAASSASPVVG